MGLGGLMSNLGMNIFAMIGLVVFFAMFVAIIAWAWSRPRRELEYQARLPLEEDDG